MKMLNFTKKLKGLLPLFISVVAVSSPFTLMALDAFNITVEGAKREYKTYIPKNLGENRPLLVSMHGMNQDADYQSGMLQIESIADTAKFAVVFPQGIDRSWDISGQRDINFVLAVIDEMAAKYQIDKNRVYLSGFSMGGMFTYHAMNHIADRIAAFAPISGYPMWGQPFESSRPVPIIHSHGTSDDVVVFDNVQARIDGWIERNGCSSTPMVTEGYRTNGCTRYQWGPGDDGAEVVLLVRGNGHWISNDGFKNGEEIWNFCKRYSLNPNMPKVNVSSPKNDHVYSVMGIGEKLGSMKISAEAIGNDADIVSVAFYANNEFIGEDTTAPFEYEWSDVPNGTYFIKAVATDSKGCSVGRAMPVKVVNRRKTFSISSEFKDGNLPAGWMTYDSRAKRMGPRADLDKGCRAIQLTGSPRDFNYGLYVSNIVGGQDKAYATFGDDGSAGALYLTVGTYSFSFDACNWDMPQNGEVRCKIYNAATDEVLAQGSVTPSVNLAGSAATPFSGSSNCMMRFGVDNEPIFAKIIFLAENAKGADFIIGNVKLQKESSEGNIDADIAGEPVVVEYFDLLGRKVAGNQGGVQVKRTLYSNGQVLVTKTISNAR